jgi:hypothetical protein
MGMTVQVHIDNSGIYTEYDAGGIGQLISPHHGRITMYHTLSTFAGNIYQGDDQTDSWEFSGGFDSGTLVFRIYPDGVFNLSGTYSGTEHLDIGITATRALYSDRFASIRLYPPTHVVPSNDPPPADEINNTAIPGPVVDFEHGSRGGIRTPRAYFSL